MSKYYRVRSQRQWDWLSHRWLDAFQTELQFDRPHIIAFYGGQVYGICDQHKGPEPVIEVSDLMEDEKMEDYVTIKDEDLEKAHWETSYGRTSFIYYDKNGEKYAHERFLPADLLIPTSLLYPKIKMTQAEKEEFDKLKDEMSLDRHDLDDLLTRIKDSEDFPFLYHRLYVADGDGVESQLEFARAWADPSLIEVLPEKKYKVKVPNAPGYFYSKDPDNTLSVSYIDENIALMPEDEFTIKDINNYGLQDCEKVEVQE